MSIEIVLSALVTYVLIGVAVTAATENRDRYRQWIAQSYGQEPKPALSGAYDILFYSVTYPVTVVIPSLGAAMVGRIRAAAKPLKVTECCGCERPMPHSTYAEALHAAKSLGDGMLWDFSSYCQPECDPVWRARREKRTSRRAS